MSSVKAEEASTTLEAIAWTAPAMHADPSQVISNRQDPSNPIEDPNIPTAEEIEKWRSDAEAEGFKQGYEKAMAENLPVMQQLMKMFQFLDSPLKELNQEVELQLSQIAVILAQQLVRRELKIEPGEIIGLIRDSVQLLPAHARNIKIVLHPEDARLFRDSLSVGEDEDEQSWKMIEDPMITRGGCKIKSESSTINATVENRLSALASSVLGGERGNDPEVS